MKNTMNRFWGDKRSTLTIDSKKHSAFHAVWYVENKKSDESKEKCGIKQE